jgi:hypothetical protein
MGQAAEPNQANDMPHLLLKKMALLKLFFASSFLAGLSCLEQEDERTSRVFWLGSQRREGEPDQVVHWSRRHGPGKLLLKKWIPRSWMAKQATNPSILHTPLPRGAQKTILPLTSHIPAFIK